MRCYSGLVVCVVAALWSVGCAARGKESSPPAAAATTSSVEATPTTPATAEERVKQEHVLYEGEDRAAVLELMARAFERYAATPRTDGGMPDFTSFAAHSQEHITRLSWEDSGDRGRHLNAHTYPTQNASWEISFIVTEQGDITNIVVATIEPQPEFPPDM